VSDTSVRGLQRLAILRHQLARQTNRRHHGDLLAQHCTNRQFQPIPGARQPQARAGRNQLRHQGVLRQLRVDHLRHDIQIKHPAQAPLDLRHGARLGKVDRHLQPVSRPRFDTDPAMYPCHTDAASIHASDHGFQAGNRSHR